jgi:hypothetical protein
MGSDGRLSCRAINGAKEVVGIDIFEIEEEEESVIVAGISDGII